MLEYVKPTNIILWADTYKFSHWEEIPHGVKRILTAVVPRKELDFTDEIVAMGQTFLAHVFATARLEQWMIDEAEVEVTEQGYTFNRAGWEYILRTYGGRIPLYMYGVEEGRVIKAQTPILTITNDDEKLAWLAPYFEPVIQSTIWSMSYTATICRYMYKTVAKYMLLTGSNMAMLEWFIHNFGDRAVTSPNEPAILKGIAHASVFSGSDCARANRYIKVLYNTSKAFTSSVEAFEHTTTMLNSDIENRSDYGALRKAVDRLKIRVEKAKQGVGIPVLSIPPDTFDDERFCTEYLPDFKEEVELSGGRLVVRPDSGKPALKLPQTLGWLENIFGSTPNAEGYRTMPWCIGALYGDGMNVHTFEPVIKAVVDDGFTLDNFLLGMGHGITNEGARDDNSTSMKAVAASFGDNWKPLLKAPKSDMSKKSLSGMVRNYELEDGTLETRNVLDSQAQYEMFVEGPGHRRWLADGYRDWRQTFPDVRSRTRAGVVVTKEVEVVA